MAGKKGISWIPVSLLFALYAGLLVHFYDNWKPLSVDFQTRYCAGRALDEGLNPYSIQALKKMGADRKTARFVYAPQTMWFNQLLALFDMKTSYLVFLVFKVILVIFLFVLWARVFLPAEVTPWFYAFALLAFNSCIWIDLSVGNIAILEELCIWLSFYFLMRNRLLLFCLPLVFIANFKIFPALFLLLLLFIDHKKKYLYFLGSAAALAVIQVLSYWKWPAYYREFLTHGQSIAQRHMDPTSSSVISAILAGGRKHLEQNLIPIQRILLVAFVAIVAYFSWRAWKGIKRSIRISPEERTRLLIFLSCLVYALVVPRFTSYSQIILIVPAWFVLRRYLSGTEGILFFILLSLRPFEKTSMMGLNHFFHLLWRYSPFFIALGLWLLFLRKAPGEGSDPLAAPGHAESA